jgi:hypothetical protein
MGEKSACKVLITPHTKANSTIFSADSDISDPQHLSHSIQAKNTLLTATYPCIPYFSNNTVFSSGEYMAQI